MKQKTVLVGILVLLVVVLVALVVSQLKGGTMRTADVGRQAAPESQAQQSVAPVSESPVAAAPESSPSPAIGAVKTPSSPVTVTLTAPANGSTVNVSTVTVRGKTLPKAEVYVNDTYTTAGADGTFSVGISLDEGENPIIVVANDSDGNMAEAELTVTYDSGK
jgi:Tfp pilus assembly protein PilX